MVSSDIKKCCSLGRDQNEIEIKNQSGWRRDEAAGDGVLEIML